MKENRKRILETVGLFFAGMVLFTLLSRAVYQQGTAVVTTQKPSGGVIAHQVSAWGKIGENQELAVITQPGLRIASVLVNEGQQVSQGDTLFTLDMEYLEEAILNQQQEMQKLKLSIQDGWSQNAAAQQRRANAQAQAQENYNSAVSRAETTLERAERNVNRAQEALDAFYQGIDSRGEREASLVSACREAEVACQEAAAALDSLRMEADAAVDAAIAEAEIGQELSPENREAIAQQIRQAYAQPIADAQVAAEEAAQRKAQAEADLAAFRSSPPEEGLSEEALIRNLEDAMDAYEDALAALDDADVTYSRGIQSASLPESTSHAPQISQISYDQMEAALQKLEALRDSGGEITAPVDAVVTQCGIQTGGKTSDNAALLLADLSMGCRFSCQITEEQSKYIGVGDKVTLKSEGSSREYKELPVTALSPQEDGNYLLTVQLPGNTAALGSSLQLRFTRKSESYPCCVPLSALRLDSHNRPYVLLAEPVDTVLGTQIQARSLLVTVLEKNENTAALEGIHSDQQVIVAADRMVDSGSRVRVQ